MKLRFSVLIFVLIIMLAPRAHAQWTVFDPTNYANAVEEFHQLQSMYTTAIETRNEVIDAYNLAYQMSRMPQDLAARYQSNFSQWTTLSAPNTYGNTSAWVNALNVGGASQASQAYNSAVIQVGAYPGGSLSSEDADTQAAIQNQYASSEIGRATVTNSLATLGTIRSDSQAFEQKLANLEADTYSTNPNEQTQNALLGKINSATFLQIHSQQDTNQILAAAAAEQTLAAKEKLDERNRLINQAIYFEQNFSNTMQQVSGGISNSIQAISLSPTER